MEFKNGFTGADEYVHHNRIYADYNKKICQTRYNYLALPQLIQFRYGHQIRYSYDAAGVKRTVKHIESAFNENLPAYISLDEEITPTALLTTTTNYINNKVYVNGQLKRILTEEGYIEKASGHYQYYYYLKDHLGNNRVVFNKTGNTEQINNYYPSGTQMAELREGRIRGSSRISSRTRNLTEQMGWIFMILSGGSKIRR
ncbi:hypothetical protein FACS189413_18610 [Bacteroidia bacterium]|nr:hypothetical protein FACS189413_18610 [Bacteroidia bacterium]